MSTFSGEDQIVGMGFDEFRSESRYMLIEGIDNRIHYVPASVGMSHKRDDGDLRNGEIIYLERREFIKEAENQEAKKVRYIYAESFRSFSDIEQVQNLKLGRGRSLSLKLGGPEI